MPEDVALKPLTFEVQREGEAATVKCHGRLVAGQTDEFYQQVKEVVSTSRSVSLDLQDLTYIDSMGLGSLTRLYVHARGAGCEFKLLHLGKQVRNLLSLTNLLSVFGSAEEHGINVA